MKENLILVINPGSTSTKVALFDGENERHSINIEHSSEELAIYPNVDSQKDFRKKAILNYLHSQNIEIDDLDGIAARAGVVGQIESGAYEINEDFVEASIKANANHPANLSPVIAYELIKESKKGIKAYIYDAVCGCGKPDEELKITGLKEIERPFLTHVLNSRAVSIEQARRDKKNVFESTYIVAHLGGGVTANLVKNGKILDFVGDDEGSFSPERSGKVPCRKLVKLCYSGKFKEKELQRKLKGEGGFLSYLSTNKLTDVIEMINKGDKYAKMIFDAMVVQLSKDISSLAPVVNGKIDKIILTGGMAHSKELTTEITKRVEFIAPVEIIAGTFEMEALAKGINRVINQKEKANVFSLS